MVRTIPVLALFGVALGLRTGARAEPTPNERSERDTMMRLHMHENFGVLRAMERSLVHGKIDEAHDLAGAIAHAPDEPGTAAWVVQIKRVRERAAALAKTTSVNDALREEAWLAATCGGCHVDSGAPEFSTPPPVAADRGDDSIPHGSPPVGVGSVVGGDARQRGGAVACRARRARRNEDRTHRLV